MEFDPLSRKVIGCAIEVHKILGPGFLESAYQQAMAYELSQAKISFEKELHLPVHCKNITLSHSYRIDILVEKKLVFRIKGSRRNSWYSYGANFDLHENGKFCNWFVI
jgi:GxxExxY protein